MRKSAMPTKRLKRWNKGCCKHVCSPEINKFVEAVLKLEKKHGLCIAHEDVQGAFVIVPYSDAGARWMFGACVSNEPISDRLL